MNILVSALHESISIDVQIQTPPDLTTAMQLAWLYERKNVQHKLNQNTFGKPRGFTPQIIKRLSRTEMEDRQAQGLCFNCDEPYNPRHHRKKLLWPELINELVDDEANWEDSDQPAVSYMQLQSKGGQTMQVMGKIFIKPVCILIDSGRTHCFLDSSLARKLALPICRVQDSLSWWPMGENLNGRE